LRNLIGSMRYQLVDMTSIDGLDADIIELLTIHPRIGVVEIARRLGVARGTVQARMAKLAGRGAVTGFGPQVDPARIGYPVLAFVSLEIAQGRLPEAVERLETIPEVLEAYGTTGPHDLLCRVVARDNEHLQEIINAILGTPAVLRSTSTIAMSRQIAPRALPLVRAATHAARGG
jgi:DNA-binding Lrp family transcriptional regulator